MNIAIYTNILTPYRKYFFDVLYENCKKKGDRFYVMVMAETEKSRNWHYENLRSLYTILLDSKTITIGDIEIHINSNLIEVLDNLDLDILVCAGGYLCPGIWKATSYAKKKNIRCLYWSESHLNESRKYSYIKRLVRERIRKQIYKRFDGFWYAGKLSKEFIECYCKNTADFFFMPNLVEEKKFYIETEINKKEKSDICKEFNLPVDKKILFCPSRLIKIKGLDKFVEILGKCSKKNEVVFAVAGDGEMKETIEKAAVANDVNIALLGYQHQESIIKLYRIADIFVLPSLSDANPLTCIEALWAGLPLFISDHCGNYPEVIENGANGFVFSYSDIEQAINMLDDLINNSSNIEWKVKAKTKSQEIALAKYSTSLTMERVLCDFHR